MDNGNTSSNGHQASLNGFISNTSYGDDTLTGEHLKTIRQLTRKLKVKDGQLIGNKFIHEMYNSWSKLSSMCEQIYTSSINYYHVNNQSKNGNTQQLTYTTTANQNDDNNNNNGIGSKTNMSSRYNGVKSLIKVVSKFVVHVENGLEDFNFGDTVACEPLLQITDMLIQLTETVNILFTTTQAIGTGKHATLYLLDIYLQSRDKLTKGIASYWSHYPAFWLDESAQWISSFFSIASSSLSKLPYSLMTLVSRSAHGYWQEDLFHSANPYYPLNLANYLNNPLLTGISRMSCRYSGLSIRDIMVPRQTQWHIPFDEEPGDGKVKFIPGGDGSSAAEDVKQIKCRLIHQGGIVPNGNVIFHVQGGAFTVELPNIYDQCFRHWTPHIGGTVILDVVYSRFVRYPVQVQELLDVFLWLANHETNNVQSILGFTPKKIIFCGDSAGGLFLFSLATILRDMQLLSLPSSSFSPGIKHFPDHLYPKAYVTFYPVLSITMPTVQPSLVLAFLDQFLTPLTILNCLSLYSSGIVFDSECINLESPDSTRYLEPSRWQAFYNTWIGKKKIWLQCDRDTLNHRIDSIAGAALTPYKSPLISYNLDLIKDLNIHLIVGEFDPFLDTNVEFSHIWPGKMTIDVLDDLGHGFLALTWTSAKSRNAARICLNRILEALED